MRRRDEEAGAARRRPPIRASVTFAASLLSILLSIALMRRSAGSLCALDAFAGDAAGISASRLSVLGAAHILGFFIGCGTAPRLIGGCHANDYAPPEDAVELTAALMFLFRFGAIASPLKAASLIAGHGPGGAIHPGRRRPRRAHRFQPLVDEAPEAGGAENPAPPFAFTRPPLIETSETGVRPLNQEASKLLKFPHLSPCRRVPPALI